MVTTKSKSGEIRIKWLDQPGEPKQVEAQTLEPAIVEPESAGPQPVEPEAMQAGPKAGEERPVQLKITVPRAAGPEPAEQLKISVPRSEATKPGPSVKLLKYEDLHRLRLGKWRVSYAVEDEHMIILVLEIVRPEEEGSPLKVKWLNWLKH